MQLTRTTSLRLIRILVVVIIVGLITSYAIWRSLNYARGPEIDISEPLNGASIASTTVLIRGQAKRALNVSLNGRAINIDEQGDFSQTIIIFPGMNQITLTASDQFGRSTKMELDLVGTR